MNACTAGVEREPGRYEWRPVCSCGWRHGWGYVAEHAALQVSQAHAGGAVFGPGRPAAARAAVLELAAAEEDAVEAAWMPGGAADEAGV